MGEIEARKARMQARIHHLEVELDERDELIVALRNDIAHLHCRVDELERAAYRCER